MKCVGIFALLALSTCSFAQFKIPGIPTPKIDIDLSGALDNIFKPEPAISTTHEEAYNGLACLDGWEPPLTQLAEEDKVNGQWILKTGAYRMELKTFCCRGYAKGPSKGMGYGIAPWKGKNAETIKKLIANWSNSQIPQQDAQLLVWGIIARVKPSKMSPQLQTELASLISPEEIAGLEGLSLDSLPDSVMDKVKGKANDAMRPFYEADNKFRDMMYKADQPFSEIEKYMVPVDENLPSSVSAGRWIEGNGYLFRFKAIDYTRFQYDVVIPNKPLIDHDAMGRITRLECPPGFVTQVQYEDSVAPMTFPDDSGIKAYAVKKIILDEPGVYAGDAPLHSDVDVQTCMLSGHFTGQPGTRYSLAELLASTNPHPQSGWYSTAQALYAIARGGYQAYKDGRSIRSAAQRLDRDVHNENSTDGVLDLDHYRSGAQSALSGGSAVGWWSNHLNRQAEAVAAASQSIDHLGEPTLIDPTSGIATPANPHGQLSALSPSSWYHRIIGRNSK